MHQFYVSGDLAPADLVFCWGFCPKCVRKQISIRKSSSLRMFRNSLVLLVRVTDSIQMKSPKITNQQLVKVIGRFADQSGLSGGVNASLHRPTKQVGQ